jgi:neuropeptide Y receptor type 1
LTSLSYLNYKLIRSLERVSQKKAVLTSQNQRCTRRDNDHITLCVVVIVCVFITCQTPALVNQIFWAALSAEERACGYFHFYYTKISDLLIVVNSSCNIVIYCFCGRRFRAIFLQTLCQWRLCTKKPPSETQSADVVLRPLEFQAVVQEATDNGEDAHILPIEDRTVEQVVSNV